MKSFQIPQYSCLTAFIRLLPDPKSSLHPRPYLLKMVEKQRLPAASWDRVWRKFKRTSLHV
jgi:hypothetical protein